MLHGISSILNILFLNDQESPLKNKKTGNLTQKNIQQQQQQFGQEEVWVKALIGDIGGTNCRLALIQFTKTSNSFQTIKRENYKNANYNSFEQCLEVFLSDISQENYPTMAKLGIAGAVFNNRVNISNIPHWPEVIGNDLSIKFKINSFKLYNDFEIASYGVVKLDEDADLIQVNGVKRDITKPMAVMGAGTGLGIAFVGTENQETKDGFYKTSYNVYPGEGGHASFPQVTEQQQRYYNFLKTKYPQKGNQIGLEYGLVGPAIPYMYEFIKNEYPELAQQNNIEKQVPIERFENFKDFPRFEVFQYGSQRKCVLSQKVVDFFIELYEQTIGDIILRTLCYGGLYLCGNITISIAQYILENKQNFLKDYIEHRGYLKSVFDKIPIYIVRKEDIGLDGAFAVAQQDFRSQ
ncbi:hypothetical protein PPERSA_12947 [Pseudocohnilembus persalinus]|uniref:Glucokinase n=1 Tax=Pseudocohnilembus persalinus TaxID=266149 RepID=A0A0V0R1R1_PSEPJ|nr:hypothetical protein PPERSA_12947 [Pseudocohnilembus persalinus]|eukprot:KRX08466.1 hypothetical protein PPERSA_12947 [Pseudocohnilembus persalinus]